MRTGKAWENLCRRCGVCCHEKIRIGNKVLITDVPCQYLDVETHLCIVYEKRKKMQVRCASALKSIELAGLPGDCPYVANIPGYSAPMMLADHPEYESLVNDLYPQRKKSM